MNKHIVMYLGGGVWKDNKGQLWGSHPTNKEIKKARTYETDESKEEFLEDRKDIAFMIEYGQMSMETVEPAKVVSGVQTNVQPVGTQGGITITGK